MAEGKGKKTTDHKVQKDRYLNENEGRKSFNPNVKPESESSTPQTNPKTIPDKKKD